MGLLTVRDLIVMACASLATALALWAVNRWRTAPKRLAEKEARREALEQEKNDAAVELTEARSAYANDLVANNFSEMATMSSEYRYRSALGRFARLTGQYFTDTDLKWTTLCVREELHARHWQKR